MLPRASQSIQRGVCCWLLTHRTPLPLAGVNQPAYRHRSSAPWQPTGDSPGLFPRQPQVSEHANATAAENPSV